MVNRKQMCKVRDFRWRFRPLPRVMGITVKMIIKGEATGGPTSSTRRERLGKRLGEVCAMNKDELKRRWHRVVKKMRFVLNPLA